MVPRKSQLVLPGSTSLETDAEPHNTERFEPSAGEVVGEGGLAFAPWRAT